MTIHYSSKDKIRVFFKIKGTVVPKILPPTLIYEFITIGFAVLAELKPDFWPAMPSFFYSLMGTGLAFLGVYMNGITYGRWWSIREYVGVIMGRTNNLGIEVRSFVTANGDSSKEKRCAILKKRIMRHANLAHALTYWQAIGKPRNGLLAIEAWGLLAPKERKVLEQLEFSPYLLAFGWLAEGIMTCFREGFIQNAEVLRMLQENVSKARGAAADVFMFLNTPFPLPYFHMFMVSQVLYGITISIFLPASLANEGVSPFLAIPGVFAINFFFYGMAGVASELENPFGDDANDFDCDGYVRTITDSSIGVLYRNKLSEEMKAQNDQDVMGAIAILPVLKEGVFDENKVELAKAITATSGNGYKPGGGGSKKALLPSPMTEPSPFEDDMSYQLPQMRPDQVRIAHYKLPGEKKTKKVNKSKNMRRSSVSGAPPPPPASKEKHSEKNNSTPGASLSKARGPQRQSSLSRSADARPGGRTELKRLPKGDSSTLSVSRSGRAASPSPSGRPRRESDTRSDMGSRLSASGPNQQRFSPPKGTTGSVQSPQPRHPNDRPSRHDKIEKHGEKGAASRIPAISPPPGDRSDRAKSPTLQKDK